MSEQHLDKLDLNGFTGFQHTADEVLVKLQPVIQETKRVLLGKRYVTDEGCVALTSSLRSNPSHMRELTLYDVNLRDSGVKLISSVLEKPRCKLTLLRSDRKDCFIGPPVNFWFVFG